MQQRVAGLVPRPHLDDLYFAGGIDPVEYMTLLLAQGWSEAGARSVFDLIHAKQLSSDTTEPLPGAIEADLPEYASPKRAAKRVVKRGNELRGHPLD
jgi:hypothetical protein